MAGLSGRMRPLDRCPTATPVALAGATRRYFALLRLSRRGAMGTCGERLGSVVLGAQVGRVDCDCFRSASFVFADLL